MDSAFEALLKIFSDEDEEGEVDYDASYDPNEDPVFKIPYLPKFGKKKRGRPKKEDYDPYFDGPKSE